MGKMMKNKENRKYFLLHLFLSLAIHSLIIVFLSFFITPAHQSPSNMAWDLEMIDLDEENLAKNNTDDTQLKKIVSQNEKPLNDITPSKNYYLSKNNQSVQKETRAEKSGEFKNSSQQKIASGATEKSQSLTKQQPQENEMKEDLWKNFNEGLEVPTKIKKKKKISISDLTPSLFPTPGEKNNDYSEQSSSDDYLKNVDTANQTLLNTREFIYYSYYQRIKGKLRQYWEPKIKEKITKIVKQGRTIASNNDKITRLVITLDNSGTLKSIQLKGASGYTDLDDAAIEAFEAAAPFPNPPQGIVEKDGSVRINWDFILES